MNKSIYLQELRHWSAHTAICALPSFLIAIQGGFNDTAAILAMLSGIITLILGYTTLSSTKLFSGNENGLLNKTKKYGLRTRSIVSLIELPGTLFLHSGGVFLVYIDLWAGIAAVQMVGVVFPPFSPSQHTFFQTYLATILEGLLVSGSIFFVMLPIVATVCYLRSIKNN